MSRLAEVDVACELVRLDDLEALAIARAEGLTIEERCELIDRRIARRQERRVVDVSVRVKCLRERSKGAREWRRKGESAERPEVQAHREAWRKR